MVQTAIRPGSELLIFVDPVPSISSRPVSRSSLSSGRLGDHPHSVLVAVLVGTATDWVPRHEPEAFLQMRLVAPTRWMRSHILKDDPVVVTCRDP
jgi:hypothetical protein